MAADTTGTPDFLDACLVWTLVALCRASGVGSAIVMNHVLRRSAAIAAHPTRIEHACAAQHMICKARSGARSQRTLCELPQLLYVVVRRLLKWGKIIYYC